LQLQLTRVGAPAQRCAIHDSVVLASVSEICLRIACILGHDKLCFAINVVHLVQILFGTMPTKFDAALTCHKTQRTQYRCNVKDGILHGEKWDEIEYLAAAMFLRICVCFFFTHHLVVSLARIARCTSSFAEHLSPALGGTGFFFNFCKLDECKSFHSYCTLKADENE